MSFWMEFVLIGLIIYFVMLPLSVVLHELGHAIPLYRVSYGKMLIEIGFPIRNWDKYWKVRCAGIEFHINPTCFIIPNQGIIYVKNWDVLSKKQKAFSAIGGPLVSIAIFVLCCFLLFLPIPPFIKHLATGSAISILPQIIFTAVPMEYTERFFGKEYAGIVKYSDGMRLLLILKNK
ncbi:site-2 protease family protein [Longirhabdus pacifica]|uniref:site-2 protease family protein n=1 Tax=Longirhabdus pacifica TaxID=2305227 RepID=UPI0010089633|nr:site-2 protease family protein [Longirhabdus pacifica]